jgi:hypothetical protein
MKSVSRNTKLAIAIWFVVGGISVIGSNQAFAATKVSAPAPVPSPRPQASPTPVPTVTPKPVVIMTVAAPIVAPKPTPSATPVAASGQLSAALNSSLAQEASKIGYQKLSNTPTVFKAGVTTVQNLGGPTQALSTLSAVARSGLSGLLDVIEGIGTLSAESGL